MDDAADKTAPGSQQNTVCRSQVWLDHRSEISSILESLSDPAIGFLDLYVRESFLMSYSDMLDDVMQTIGSLPKLERLDISCPYSSMFQGDNNTRGQSSIPVTAVRMALTKGLTHILLINVKLNGSHRDFEEFAAKIQTLPRLHCVVMADIRLFNPVEIGDKSYSVIDPLFRAFTRVPSIGHVLVSGSQDLGCLQPSTVAMCQQNIRDLVLSQLSLETSHLQAMATNTKSNLRELDLQCHLTVDGARALAKMLENNKSLEELTLRLTKESGSFRPTPRTAAAYAVLAMGTNDGTFVDTDEDEPEGLTFTYKENEAVINVDKYWKKNSEHARNMILAEAIARSNGLTSFDLESADLSTPSLLEPFHDMIRDSYSLETVRLHCCVEKDYCLENEIAFYTRLNQLGRGHLFRCPYCSHCDEAYIAMLESLGNGGDLSAFYYFLSSKPSLLMKGLSGVAKDADRRKVLGKRKRLYRAAKYKGVSYTI